MLKRMIYPFVETFPMCAQNDCANSNWIAITITYVYNSKNRSVSFKKARMSNAIWFSYSWRNWILSNKTMRNWLHCQKPFEMKNFFNSKCMLILGINVIAPIYMDFEKKKKRIDKLSRTMRALSILKSNQESFTAEIIKSSCSHFPLKEIQDPKITVKVSCIHFN